MMNFAQHLISTAAMYGKSVSEWEIAMWEEDLSRFDEESKIRALKEHRKNADNGQFMPKIADIIKLIEGDSKDRAMLAWGKAFKAITQVGQYEDVCFDDGVIHTVIDEMGGWVKFCLMESDDISYMQHRFCELYRSNCRVNKSFPKFLVGVAGEQNRLNCLEVKPPVPIGDTEQCRLVYKNGGGSRNKGGNILADVTQKLTQQQRSEGQS